MLVALAMAAAVVTQPPPATSAIRPAVAEPQDRATDEALIRERASAWGAAFTRGDVSTIDSILADDFVGTAKDGTLYDKPTMLGWVRTGPKLTSSQTSVSRIRFLGEIAIATGTDDMVGPAPIYKRIKNIWTDIWARRDGQWRVVAAHDMAGTPTEPGVFSAALFHNASTLRDGAKRTQLCRISAKQASGSDDPNPAIHAHLPAARNLPLVHISGPTALASQAGHPERLRLGLTRRSRQQRRTAAPAGADVQTFVGTIAMNEKAWPTASRPNAH